MERLGREAVVDTSVVVKFFVVEQDSDKALGLLRACLANRVRLIAPDHLFIEFTNVMWSKTLQRELTEEEAEARILLISQLSSRMQVVPVRGILHESLKAACDCRHPAYDTAFLALAEAMGIPLVTADVKFYNKIRQRFPSAVLLTNLSA